MDKFNTHQVTMGIKKSIKQQNSKQKRHIAPKSKEFRSWILRKVIDNGKNNSLNIWILNNPKIWGTHLNRREVVMGPLAWGSSVPWNVICPRDFLRESILGRNYYRTCQFLKGQGECYVIHKGMVNILMKSAVKPLLKMWTNNIATFSKWFRSRGLVTPGKRFWRGVANIRLI